MNTIEYEILNSSGNSEKLKGTIFEKKKLSRDTNKYIIIHGYKIDPLYGILYMDNDGKIIGYSYMINNSKNPSDFVYISVNSNTNISSDGKTKLIKYDPKKIKKLINKKTKNKSGFNNIKFNLRSYNNINNKIPNQLYTREILKNTYQNKNNLYNKIVQHAVDKIQELLLIEDDSFFIEKLDNIRIDDSFKEYIASINTRYNTDIRIYYRKFIYIVFIFLACVRFFIFYLQQNINVFSISNKKKKYGVTSLFENVPIKRTHPYTMNRFTYIYMQRIIYNLSQNIEINISSINDNKKIKIETSISFIPIESNNVYISNLNENIYDSIYIKYRLELIKKDSKIKFEIDMEKNFYYIEQVSFNLDSRLFIIDYIVHYFRQLDILHKTNINSNINEKKKYILIIYYLIIFLMPFYLGTASIAEMFLYSLWKYYIRKIIKIRQEVMLDVEALSLPHNIFVKNCLEKDDKEGNNIIYTPYLIE